MIQKSVGIDVSKDTLVVCLSSPEKQRYQCANTLSGIEELIRWLESQKIEKSCPIVVESTSSYHWLLCLCLREQELDVRLINPIITKKYQRSSVRNAKTDRVDAERLAEIGQLEPDLPRFFDSREQLSQKRCQSLIQKLETVKQELGRAYRDAEESFARIGIEMDLECVENALKQIEESLQVLKRMIEAQADNMARELAQNIRGLSLYQASVLLTAVGGRTFGNREQFIAFFGLDISRRQSGTWQGREKLSKRGNPYYRKILFQLGWSLQRNNEMYHSYYQQIRDRGKHYFTAILATARKFLRFLFSFLHQNHFFSLDASL